MTRLRRMSLPYFLWMGVLLLIPTMFLILLGFSNLDLYDLGAFRFTLTNFTVFAKSSTLISLWNSLFLSFLTTLLCFVIGYPVAYYLASLKEKTGKILLSLLIVPLWSNMLLRINAWEKIFTPGSIFTDLFGLSFNLLGTRTAVVIGMVGMYLPFMIFPIYSVLERMDRNLVEAAKDLGAGDWHTFSKVIFPLSSGGVVSGVIMTMLPAMTSFVLPARLGLGTTPLIGNVIQSKFMIETLGSSGESINQGSLISLLIMLFSIFAFVMVVRVDKEGETLL